MNTFAAIYGVYIIAIVRCEWQASFRSLLLSNGRKNEIDPE